MSGRACKWIPGHCNNVQNTVLGDTSWQQHTLAQFAFEKSSILHTASRVDVCHPSSSRLYRRYALPISVSSIWRLWLTFGKPNRKMVATSTAITVNSIVRVRWSAHGTVGNQWNLAEHWWTQTCMQIIMTDADDHDMPSWRYGSATPCRTKRNRPEACVSHLSRYMQHSCLF
jgi:hypothetical protein